MTWNTTHIDQLRNASLFTGLDEQQLKQALKNTLIKTMKSGEQLFSQGEDANHFFWLRTGLLKIYRLSPAGEEKVIKVVKPGQTFAEAIMFAGKPNHYHVSAEFIENGEIWCFSNQDFKEILSHSVETCFRLMTNMSQRLHKHINEIDRLTLQTATDRVINYLLLNTPDNDNEIHLITSKQILAAQLSIKPETLSRTLRKLNKEGLIKTEGNVIRLLDLEALYKKVEV
ncbi:MAG: Crp/Fnr family transcriptional regulator [Gammaproteobacteria bacterium]|nr:Crp/Fnr family transcriptional regulator [Gammaproteobacteria bacterium]